ncbi:MAG TPA: cysteine methyltransferase [Alphaproteobacteria bacterium]|nr:cysteine methyltransferase [Alphaproteobacteria bacterium]
MFYTIYQSKFCPIILVGDEKGLKHLHLDTKQGKREFFIDSSWIKKDEFFIDVVFQLEEYFAGSRTAFDVKLNQDGTDYQKKVWSALQQIPYGELHSYKDVAIAIGNDKASRAVGMANSKNPIPLIVPCHRVVGADKKLTGFAHGLEIKAKLIELEGIKI